MCGRYSPAKPPKRIRVGHTEDLLDYTFSGASKTNSHQPMKPPQRKRVRWIGLILICTLLLGALGQRWILYDSGSVDWWHLQIIIQKKWSRMMIMYPNGQSTNLSPVEWMAFLGPVVICKLPPGVSVSIP